MFFDIILIPFYITQHIVLERIWEGIWKTNSSNLEIVFLNDLGDHVGMILLFLFILFI